MVINLVLPVIFSTFYSTFQVIYKFRGGLHQVVIDDKDSLRIPLKSK